MMREVLLFVFLFGIYYIVEGRPLVTAQEQFTADFSLTSQYNLSFHEEDIPGYIPIPFIQSPTVSPIRGKIWFNYDTAEFRMDIFSAEGSPWKLSTTVIAHSYAYIRNQYSFNCSTDIYFTAGTNKCWYGVLNQVNLPNQMGGNMNLTYNGTRVVDGQECMVFLSNTGYLYAVRLEDLAIVEVDLPYFIGELMPYFNFFGYGDALTQVSLSNIVIGAPDPSNFYPPQGVCLQVYNDSTINYNNEEKSLEKFFKSEIISEMAQKTFSRHLQPKDEKQKHQTKKRDSNQMHPPPLNQTFSASWLMNVSAPYAPFTPYTLSGTLGFDFTISGFVITLDTITGNVPFNLQFALRIYPDRNGIEFLQVGPDGSCYSYLYLQWIWTYLFPIFQIPYDADYRGTAQVNGDTCSSWKTTWQWYDHFAELYVRESDNVLIQSTIPDPISYAPSTFTLSNVQGTVSPSTYSRPNNCAEIMNWSTSFASHLPWAWCYPWCDW